MLEHWWVSLENEARWRLYGARHYLMYELTYLGLGRRANWVDRKMLWRVTKFGSSLKVEEPYIIEVDDVEQAKNAVFAMAVLA